MKTLEPHKNLGMMVYTFYPNIREAEREGSIGLTSASLAYLVKSIREPAWHEADYAPECGIWSFPKDSTYTHTQCCIPASSTVDTFSPAEMLLKSQNILKGGKIVHPVERCLKTQKLNNIESKGSPWNWPDALGPFLLKLT